MFNSAFRIGGIEKSIIEPIQAPHLCSKSISKIPFSYVQKCFDILTMMGQTAANKSISGKVYKI